jgi:DNA polymerase-1
VGEKTAMRLVLEHGDLERVLAAADDVKQPKLAASLKEHAELARLSRRLVTIDLTAPVSLADCRPGSRDVARLRELFLALEFSARLETLAGSGEALRDVRYHTVDTADGVRALARRLAESHGFVLDTETTGLDPMQADLVGIAVAWEPGEAWYVPLNVDPPMFPGGRAAEPSAGAQGRLFATEVGRDTDAVLDLLRPALEDPTLPKTGQNLKYDLHVLERHGVAVRGVDFDTMVADWCVDPGGRTHNLDDMALRRLGIQKTPTSALIGGRRSEATMAEIPIPDVARYACEDADVTLRLRRALEPELEAKGVASVFREVEMPLLPVLVRMEHAGIRLDAAVLRRISEDLARRAEAAEARIYELAGETFNVRSNAALSHVLFETMRLHEKAGRRRPKKTAKGTGFSTDEQTLAELAEHDELPARVLEYRSLTKLKSTYVDTLPAAIHPGTGRIHTTFHQTGAATGRLSSSDPNLQNIPIRSEEGRAIRRAFVPEEGWWFLSADYSQIELRLLAHFSGDDGLLGAFRAGEDIHRATAARVFKVAPDEVTPLQRSRAKAVNFGVIYGMGPQRLARDTQVSLEEARRFIEQYFDTYPGVKAWQERTIAEARRSGFVTTLLGRRRLLPDLRSDDPRIRNQAENVAVNTPLQGTAADLVKVAMIRIHRRLEGARARMLVQIHDELLFEVPEDERDATAALVRREMSEALDLRVPIVVDVGWGRDWSEAH